MPKDIWETYSAFANTEGGVIILGVNDDGEIIGLKKPKQRIKEFIDTANNPSKCSINLCHSDKDISILSIEEKEIVAIRVPRADCEDRPVYVNNICYRRYDETDKRCNFREIDKLNSERLIVVRDDYSEDDAIVEGTTTKDIDTETLRQYRNVLQNVRAYNPWEGESDKEFLTSINAYRIDVKERKEGLTLAGLLMFGSAQALDRWKPSLQLDYQEYDESEGSSIEAKWVDRVTNDTTWPCNLYRFYTTVFPKLIVDIKTPFMLNSEMAREDKRPAHIAIKEALANTLIHAAYRSECHIKILKLSTGLIFENSGSLLLRKEQVMRGGLSRCRNKRIQNMFRLVGIVDKAGTGVKKIINGWLTDCICPPYVSTERDPEIVRWLLPYIGLGSKKNMKDFLRSLPAEKRDLLNKDDIIIIAILINQVSCNHSDIKNLYPIHSADISKILTKLKKLDLVSSEGNSRATVYSISDRYLHEPEHAGNIIPFNLNIDKNSPDNGGNSLDNGGNSPDNGGNSLDNGGNSPDNGERNQTREELLFTFDDNLRSTIEATSLKKRWFLDDMLLLIPQICRNRYLTLHQLSILLKRNKEYIRSRYIQYLVALGKLKRKYDEDNDPKQAYTSTEE